MNNAGLRRTTVALIAGSCALSLALPEVAMARAPSKTEYRAVTAGLARLKAYRSDKGRVATVEVSDLDPSYARADIRTSRNEAKQALLARSGAKWVVTRYGVSVWHSCSGAPRPVIDSLFKEANCSGTATVAPPPTGVVTQTPSPASLVTLTATMLATDGTLLKEPSRAEIYVIYGGAKFLTNGAMFAAGSGTGLRSDAVKVVADGSLASVPTVPRDGTVLTELTGGKMWLVAGGARFALQTVALLRQLGHETKELRTVAKGVVEQIPTVPRDGAMLREYDSTHPVLFLGGARFGLDAVKLATMGLTTKAVVVVPNGSLAAFGTTPRDGVVLREPTNSPTFILVGGAAIGIPSEAALRALGKTAGDVALVPTGTIALFAKVPRDGSVLRESSSSSLSVMAGGARFSAPAGYAIERLGRTAAEVLIMPDGSIAQLPAVPKDGTLLREGINGQLSLVTVSALFRIPAGFNLSLLGRSANDAIVIPEGSAALLGSTPPNGSIVRGQPSGQIWQFSGGQRVATTSSLPQSVPAVPDSELERFPVALQDGMFVRATGDQTNQVWVVVGGAKFALLTSTMATLGYPNLQINVIALATFQSLPFTPRDYTVVREVGSNLAFLVVAGGRLPIVNPASLSSIGQSAQSVKTIPIGGINQIPAVPRTGTLLKEPSSGTVWQMLGTIRRAVPVGSSNQVLLVPDGSLSGIAIG